MPTFTDPATPVAHTAITVPFYQTNIQANIQVLRNYTGAGEPPGANLVAVTTGPTLTAWIQVPRAAIADDAIDSSKIAGGAIQESDIGDLQIGTGKIKADAIVNDRILNNTINASEKLAPGSIVNNLIVDGTINAGTKLLGGSIVRANIQDGEVVGSKIPGLAILNSHIAANTIDASAKLQLGSIVNNLIVDGTIAGTKLFPNTLTAAQIAPGAIGVTEITDLAVRTAKLDAKAVTTGKIDDGAVTATQIGTDAVTTPKIQNQAVTAAKIFPLTITDAQIALANKDGTAGTLGLRTLGQGAQQAASGDHVHTAMASMATGSYVGASTGGRQIAAALNFTPKNVLFQLSSAGGTVNAGHAYMGTTAKVTIMAPSNTVTDGNVGAYAAGAITVPASLNITGTTYDWMAFG